MDWSVVLERAPDLAAGLLRTLLLCAVSALAALALGGALTYGLLRGSKALRAVINTYTALCLGVPLLIVIYLLFYALPNYGLMLSSHIVGILALSIYYGPYFAEVMRSAMLAIPTGQVESATAIGLSPARTVWRILMPQALPLMLPSLAGLTIGMIKDSALLAVVSVPEFMFFAKQAVADTYAPVEIYVTVAATYWTVNAACAFGARQLERRLTVHLVKHA